MEISIRIAGKPYRLRPVEGAPSAEVVGWRCSCGATHVQGRRMHHDHDTYRAIGHCAKCSAELGNITARVSTLFGIDEDNAVLNGRPRVY